MRKTLTIYALILLCFIIPVSSQTHSGLRIIEEVIEELTMGDITDDDLSLIYDDLVYYLENPVDINSADADEFRKLYIINDLQISNLIAYRERHGELLTVYELQYVEGFSSDILRKLMPFIFAGTVRPGVVEALKIARAGRHQVFLRFQQILEEQKGYSAISESDLASNPNSRYLGSPLKIYNRYQFNYRNRIQAGYVGEKDAGEEFFRGSNPYGFDHYSAHVQINDIGRIRTLTLGDYQAGFGQGLVLWSGLALGKSVSTLNVRKNARGLQKYSSTDENLFLRGGGITCSISPSSELSLFISRKKIDAGVSALDENNRVREVSTLRTTGLHATPSQVAGKNVLGETIYGGNFIFNHNLFRLGATFAALQYDAEVNPPERVYNQFYFRGSRNVNIGTDYQFSIGRVRFFGEGAISRSGGRAILGGAMANVSSRMSLSAIYRNYSRDYHACFSNGFSENTHTSNEKGFYLGTEVYPDSRWKVSAFVDFFSFPWLSYGAYAPSSGVDYFLQTDFSQSRNLNMYISFRHKAKPVNAPSGENHTRYILDSGLSRVRFHVSYLISSSLEFRNRLELSEYRREGSSSETGFLLYQDILFRPGKLPLSMAFRYAVFDTDTYNARIYAYENDVLYAFSIPAYYDRGFRSYLLLQYSPGRSFDLWLRYALTKLPGMETIGSGLNEITGDAKSELKVQARFRF